MKKKQFKLTRKQFFIILSALLAVVVIAETVLLVKTFAGKKSSKKTPKGTSTKEATPSPVPQDVRKVARVDCRGSWAGSATFTYDEFGRETMAEVYSYGKLKYVEMTYYYNNGNKRELLMPGTDNDGNEGVLMLQKVTFTDICGGVFQIVASDSLVTTEHFDEDGNLIELDFFNTTKESVKKETVSWTYRDGVMVGMIATEGDARQEKMRTRREYDYDASGRVCTIWEYQSKNGETESLVSTSEITYGGNRRTETVNRNGVINENVYLNGTLASCSYVYPEGDMLEFQYLNIPEFGKLVRTDFGTPYHQLCYAKHRYENGDEVTTLNPEYDRENRVITARDEGVRTGNYYRRFRYSYGENGRLETFYIDVLTFSDILEYTTEYHYHYDAFGDVDSILIYTSDGEQPVSEVTIEWITVPGTVQ